MKYAALFATIWISISLQHMNPKEQADVLLGLIEGHMAHFRQTRDIEFKVNISLWTLIVLVGHFLYENNIRPKKLCEWFVFAAISLLIVLGHWLLWMRPIQFSTDADSRRIKHYRHRIEELVSISTPTPPNSTHGWMWVAFEIAITGVLLVGVGFVLAFAKHHYCSD